MEGYGRLANAWPFFFPIIPPKNMKLGAFSVSLSVKDLTASQQFYTLLGFEQMAGSVEKNYLIMRNEQTLIGLFAGMFEGNLLTFNPGWDANAQPVDVFDDVRAIHQKLLDSGQSVEPLAGVNGQGPAHFMVKDPDGNVLLFDQHL
jgi:catechol 2,3-dioxygenase-like lactoylglutathione lyase family enzyme